MSETHPLVFHVKTADLDKLLARGLEFQRGLLEACEAERNEVAEELARAAQARIDFVDYMKSECLGMIEISLFPTARNWCWEVERVIESDEIAEEDEDEEDEGLFDDEDENGEY